MDVQNVRCTSDKIRDFVTAYVKAEKGQRPREYGIPGPYPETYREDSFIYIILVQITI